MFAKPTSLLTCCKTNIFFINNCEGECIADSCKLGSVAKLLQKDKICTLLCDWLFVPLTAFAGILLFVNSLRLCLFPLKNKKNCTLQNHYLNMIFTILIDSDSQVICSAILQVEALKASGKAPRKLCILTRSSKIFLCGLLDKYQWRVWNWQGLSFIERKSWRSTWERSGRTLWRVQYVDKEPVALSRMVDYVHSWLLFDLR